MYAYVGSWGAPAKETAVGISKAEYTARDGIFIEKEQYFPEINCGAVCINRQKNILYYVNERSQIKGRPPGGEVYALKINPEDGTLTELNHMPSYGVLPSYCAVDRDGKFLIVTHHAGRNAITRTVRKEDGTFELEQEYDETSVVLFRLKENGEIAYPCDIVKHKKTDTPGQQENQHAHCVKISPCGSIFSVCDKGNDSVYFYRIDREKGRLVCCSRISSLPGSAPRYCVFHPMGKWLYFNNESRTVLNAAEYTEEGKARLVHTVSCLESGSLTDNGRQSDLCISRDGKYLYDLMRENSTISVFEIDPENGKPTLIQSVACGTSAGGRALALSPDGKYLHVAGYPDKCIVTCRVGKDGRLEKEREQFMKAAPANIVFLEE